MTSDTELKWRIKILHKDCKTDDMKKVCDFLSDDAGRDCKSMSYDCMRANRPTMKTCLSCLCGVCNRSHVICRTITGKDKV
jgi:hypothetical protein